MIESIVRGILLIALGYVIAHFKPFTLNFSDNGMKVQVEDSDIKDDVSNFNTIEDVSIGDVTGKYTDVYAHLSDGSTCKVKFLNKGLDNRQHVIENIYILLMKKCVWRTL